MKFPVRCSISRKSQDARADRTMHSVDVSDSMPGRQGGASREVMSGKSTDALDEWIDKFSRSSFHHISSFARHVIRLSSCQSISNDKLQILVQK